MNEVLNTLLGLDDIRFGVDGVRFGFERPWAAWLWPLLGAVAVASAWWAYHRMPIRRGWKIALGTTRALALLLVLLVISGPALIEHARRVERDWIMVLADRSASMQAADALGGRTRSEAMAEAFRSAWPAWSERAERSRIVWLGFADGVYDLPATEAGITLGAAEGLRTDIAGALDEALDRAAARSLAGVVVLSDGRASGPIPDAIGDRLRTSGAPVYTVPLGATGPTQDLAVSASAAGRVFIDDAVPVEVRIDQVGAGAVADGVSATVRLMDEATGRVLDEREVRTTAGEDGGTTELTLTATPTIAGVQRWRVEVEASGRDLVAENNEHRLSLEVLDEPLRVVYLDGTPRWEHRYLKNLLLREDSITSSSLLLAPRRRFTQEGNVALPGLPTSPEEWASVDVVILGDVRPELLGDETMADLRDHVASRGAGLVWIGGGSATPHAFRGTPLAPLLPFTAAGRGVTPTFDEPITLERTPAADALGVLRLGDSAQDPWPAQLSDPEAGWSRLWGVQRISIDQLKPAAVSLAAARGHSLEGEWPAVMTMRYGAGRVVYLAVDETWRYRYGLGDLLFDRFWLPMVRMAGRQSVGRFGAEAVVRIDPRRPISSQPASVELRLLDQALVDAAPASLAVDLVIADDPDALPQRVTLRRQREGEPTFLGTWIPSQPGVHALSSASPLLAGSALDQRVEVIRADSERRDPRPDHALLASLSERSGGRSVRPDELGVLAEEIPNREVVVASPPRIQSLWDTPVVLLALVTLLALEWAARRWFKLA